MHRTWIIASGVLLMLASTLGTADRAGGATLDPPHNASLTIPPDPCGNCHMLHQAAGGAITNFAGNANVCVNCHSPGQSAQDKPFVNSDQAIPGTSGTSHRWDSGASGWVKIGAANTSTGTVRSGGVYTGIYAKTYTITISTAGDTGTARFNWTATTPGGGSGTNVLTGTNVALDQGITVTSTNGTNPSFKLGDVWNVYVRPDIRQPTSPAMAGRLSSGKFMCSTCHNQHSQVAAPFDPLAPAYPTAPPTPTPGGPTPTPRPGAGAGRHYQRLDNDVNQMCLDCHNVRNVASSTQGSHPVGVAIPAIGKYKTPRPTPTPF